MAVYAGGGGGIQENPMITKSGYTVLYCSSKSMVYIRNPITPLDSQKIKEFVALSEDRNASRAAEGEGAAIFVHVFAASGNFRAV